MSSRVSLAVAACEHWIGHETAHLDPAEQIEACERLIASWTATITEIKAENGMATACADCPPVGYPTDKTRCAECPRAAAETSEGVDLLAALKERLAVPKGHFCRGIVDRDKCHNCGWPYMAHQINNDSTLCPTPSEPDGI